MGAQPGQTTGESAQGVFARQRPAVPLHGGHVGRLGQITGIEVKASATVDSKDFKGLRHLQKTESSTFQRGIVLYAGREVVPFGDKLWAVPLSVWWASGAI
jgi:hypothetical protein